MIVQTLLNQLGNFPPPTGRDNRQVAILTMAGPISGKVITGYNYDSDQNIVTLFANGGLGSGMPANLLAHSMETQAVSKGAEVQWNGVPVLAVVGYSQLSYARWEFLTDKGTTAIMVRVGEEWRLKVHVELDVTEVRELGEWAIENPQHYLYPFLQALHVRTCETLGLSDL